MLEQKKIGNGKNITSKLSWIEIAHWYSNPAVISSMGWNPIVISIKIVIKRKLKKLIAIFFLALLAPKYSVKISVHKKVDANKIVPNATGSEKKLNFDH